MPAPLRKINAVIVNETASMADDFEVGRDGCVEIEFGAYGAMTVIKVHNESGSTAIIPWHMVGGFILEPRKAK